MNVVEPIPKPAKSAYEQLPRRYRRFVDQWVGGKTGVDAIKAAGYKKQYAHQMAYKLSRREDVQAAIAEREAAAVREAGVRHVRTLSELQAIGYADPRKLVNPETGKALSLKDLPADIAAAISSVEVEEISTHGLEGTRYKYRFWDKNKALDKLGQYLKLWDTKGPTVNVDARSVTVNAPGGADSLQSALRLLEQARAIAAPIAAALGDTDGSVLPAPVRDEPPRRRASLDAGEDT